MFRWTYGVVFLFVGLGLMGCDGAEEGRATGRRGEGQRGRYRIVATTGMVGDIVRQVAGEHGQVVTLMGAGVDPHLYSVQTSDAKKMRKADVVIYSGLHLEGKMIQYLQGLKKRGKTVIAVTGGLSAEELVRPRAFKGHPDPHVWMDVALWGKCAEFVAESLGKYDQAHAADYQKNVKVYLEKLKKLDAYVKRVTKKIPQGKRVLVTAHDAFGYYARVYGLKVKAIQGISTDSEAGIGDINRLVDYLVAHQIRAIFVETSVDQRFVMKVVENARIKGHELLIGGKLFSDAMGKAGTYRGTFIGMIDHNATTIAIGLGAKGVEVKGMRGGFKVLEGGE